MPDKNNGLSEQYIDPDPFNQFSKWYSERIQPSFEESGTCVLATSGADRRPAARVVLVKEFSEQGFVFYTNYSSRKAIQISENPFGALLFHWPEVSRQVRIEGRIEKVPESKSALYFSRRKRESQLAAWASDQSRPIPDRKFLENRVDLFKRKFKGDPVTKPPGWGGYILIPVWFEFWQAGKDRLHDRISYRLVNDAWNIDRLAP